VFLAGSALALDAIWPLAPRAGVRCSGTGAARARPRPALPHSRSSPRGSVPVRSVRLERAAGISHRVTLVCVAVLAGSVAPHLLSRRRPLSTSGSTTRPPTGTRSGSSRQSASSCACTRRAGLASPDRAASCSGGATTTTATSRSSTATSPARGGSVGVRGWFGDHRQDLVSPGVRTLGDPQATGGCSVDCWAWARRRACAYSTLASPRPVWPGGQCAVDGRSPLRPLPGTANAQSAVG